MTSNAEGATARYRGVGLELLDAVRDREKAKLVHLRLRTDAGEIIARYHPAQDARAGVVWVGGAGGGLDGPARGLYPEACRLLQEHGIAGLRLHYRHPNELLGCVLDALLGITFFQMNGVEDVALVGHSFGGAVVIAAGAHASAAKAEVAMSTQTYGADAASRLSPRALLLIHGTDDQVLPHACSRQVYRAARPPKELSLYAGAGHGLDEARDAILDLLTQWLPAKLEL